MYITGNAFPLSFRFVSDLKYELSTFALSLSCAYISSFCLSGYIINLSGFFMKDLIISSMFAICIHVF